MLGSPEFSLWFQVRFMKCLHCFSASCTVYIVLAADTQLRLLVENQYNRLERKRVSSTSENASETGPTLTNQKLNMCLSTTLMSI